MGTSMRNSLYGCHAHGMHENCLWVWSAGFLFCSHVCVFLGEPPATSSSALRIRRAVFTLCHLPQLQQTRAPSRVRFTGVCNTWSFIMTHSCCNAQICMKDTSAHSLTQSLKCTTEGKTMTCPGDFHDNNCRHITNPVFCIFVCLLCACFPK